MQVEDEQQLGTEEELDWRYLHRFLSEVNDCLVLVVLVEFNLQARERFF